MRTLYEDYVRFYLLLDYSRDESEFHARRKLRGNDMSNSLQDAQEQLARKRAKVHSLTQDKEQLIKEKADLMEQNRTLRNEVAHLTQQVLAQADTNAQATIDTINTTNAETPARSRYNDKLPTTG